jgi:hypothetical protein
MGKYRKFTFEISVSYKEYSRDNFNIGHSINLTISVNACDYKSASAQAINRLHKYCDNHGLDFRNINLNNFNMIKSEIL